jgi:hypothetical protein
MLPQRPYFWNSQSRLSSGHTWRVLSQREMQWKWKACCSFESQYMISYVPIARQNKTHIADSPRDGALLACGGGLVGLAVDAQVHDVVAADGAVVDDDVPGPERDGVPLADIRVSLWFLFERCALVFLPSSPRTSSFRRRRLRLRRLWCS